MDETVTGLQHLHYFSICHSDLEAENIMITPEMRAVIADFSHATKITNVNRRYGLRVYDRSPEAGNMNGYCPSVDGKAFDYWSYGILCSSAKIGKFLQNKETWITRKKKYLSFAIKVSAISHFL